MPNKNLRFAKLFTFAIINSKSMSENKQQNTNISELGEFGLIQRLTNDITIKNVQSIKGIGDDAAVLAFSGEQIVVTTDLLIEGVHFNLAYTPLKHLGYKAAVVNISDILAMNAFPKQLLVSFAVSNRFSIEALEELYEGIKIACKEYGTDLVGGDTCSSQKGLFLSITAIGSAQKDEIVYRGGAKINDILCVTGNLGAAYMGLQLLERENRIFLQDPLIKPNLDGYDYILERQLRPIARIDMILYFKNQGIIPTSMIDISDGLSSETIHLCTNSGLGCKIFADKIPIANETSKMAAELNMEPVVCALNGGEDYELLFSISPFDFKKIQECHEITPIGHFVAKEEGLKLVLSNIQSVDLSPKGWNAFEK
jgi:thiamine-monophosphate kinase